MGGSARHVTAEGTVPEGLARQGEERRRSVFLQIQRKRRHGSITFLVYMQTRQQDQEGIDRQPFEFAA
ncbi:hypothetical protein SDC9_191141 [bioreactor metagenome]|uniref:Uncharacterized protein n=1 Tax=bioreactor metagenome TaxID=1076179 RepID=A0A645HX19_9ZZZZ